MTGLRTIDVSVTHTLGVDTAWERVLRWMGSAATDGVEPIGTDIDHLAHRIRLTLNVHGSYVRATITVSNNVVGVSSETISGPWLLVAGGTTIAESKISAQLKDILR